MPKVLVIDDDSQVREMLAEMMRRVGYESASTGSGREGLVLLQKDSFDVVILDMIMPDMNGVDTIAEIRSAHPDVKVVALSGGGSFGRFDLLDKAMKHGAAAVLRKPVDFEEITTTVGRLLGRENDTAGDRAG